jgi:hypothetical protein
MNWLYVFSNEWFAYFYQHYSLLMLNLGWIIPAILKTIAKLDPRVSSDTIDELIKIWGGAKKPPDPIQGQSAEVTK